MSGSPKTWNRLIAVAGSSLLALMLVPSALAMPEGGGRVPVEQAIDPVTGTAPRTPAGFAETTSSGFGWTGAIVVLLVSLALLAAIVAVHHTASRRGARLAAR